MDKHTGDVAGESKIFPRLAGSVFAASASFIHDDSAVHEDGAIVGVVFNASASFTSDSHGDVVDDINEVGGRAERRRLLIHR